MYMIIGKQWGPRNCRYSAVELGRFRWANKETVQSALCQYALLPQLSGFLLRAPFLLRKHTPTSPGMVTPCAVVTKGFRIRRVRKTPLRAQRRLHNRIVKKFTEAIPQPWSLEFLRPTFAGYQHCQGRPENVPAGRSKTVPEKAAARA